MSGPAWVVDGLAAVMLAISAYCLGRLAFARLWRRPLRHDVNIAHVLMGIGMAGMLVAGLRFGPAGVWEIVFGLLTLWFAVQVGRLLLGRSTADLIDGTHKASHYVAHLAMAGAMVYMFGVGMYATTSGAVSGWTGYAPLLGSASPELLGSPSPERGIIIMTGGSSGHALVTSLFVVVLVMSAVWQLDGLAVLSRRLVSAPAAMAPAEGAAVPAIPTSGSAASAIATSLAVGIEPPACSTGARFLAPRLEALVHIVMCVTMGYMLVSLL